MKTINKDPGDITSDDFLESLEPDDLKPENIKETLRKAFDQGYSFGSRYIMDCLKDR